MLIESKPTITSISYSEITSELTIKYSDNNIVKYINVPKDVYENIVKKAWKAITKNSHWCNN